MEVSELVKDSEINVGADISKDLLSTLNSKYSLIETIDNLSLIDIFSDYKKLIYPEERLKTIQIKEKLWNYSLVLQFKNPEISKTWLVSQWHFQVNLYEWSKKLWFLNARLMPQSWKIKFSWMKKTDRSKNWIGNILIQKYLEVAEKFKSELETIDYSQTTSQMKIDVAYYLKNNWYKPNTSSPRNRFSVYRDKNWNLYIYTISQNTVKWYNSDTYQYLNSKPDNDPDYYYLWDVFAWSSVFYKYSKE